MEEEYTYSISDPVCDCYTEQDGCASEPIQWLEADDRNNYYDWKTEKEAEVGIIIDASWGETGRFLTIYREPGDRNPSDNEEAAGVDIDYDSDLIITYKNNLFDSADAVYAWCYRHWDQVLKDILNKLNS